MDTILKRWKATNNGNDSDLTVKGFDIHISKFMNYNSGTIQIHHKAYKEPVLSLYIIDSSDKYDFHIVDDRRDRDARYKDSTALKIMGDALSLGNEILTAVKGLAT